MSLISIQAATEIAQTPGGRVWRGVTWETTNFEVPQLDPQQALVARLAMEARGGPPSSTGSRAGQQSLGNSQSKLRDGKDERSSPAFGPIRSPGEHEFTQTIEDYRTSGPSAWNAQTISRPNSGCGAWTDFGTDSIFG